MDVGHPVLHRDEAETNSPGGRLPDNLFIIVYSSGTSFQNHWFDPVW